MHHLARRRRDGRGQALTEFALVAPIFFLLIFAVIEFGILFGGQNGLVASARELARYAAPYRVKTATDATQVCADTRLGTQLTNSLKQEVVGYNSANMGLRSVTYSWHPNPASSPQTYYVQLQIHISYHFPLHVPLVGNIIDGADGVKVAGKDDGKYLLDATETMRIENEDLTTSYSDVTCTI
jgi:hypothetical protein